MGNHFAVDARAWSGFNPYPIRLLQTSHHSFKNLALSPVLIPFFIGQKLLKVGISLKAEIIASLAQYAIGQPGMDLKSCWSAR